MTLKKKLGWFEVNQDKDLGYEGLIVGIFSTNWRTGEDEPDCFFPDIILALKQIKSERLWFIAEMSITNPEIVDFAELAIKVLKEIKGKNFTTLNEITTHLSTFLDDKIPEHLAW